MVRSKADIKTEAGRNGGSPAPKSDQPMKGTVDEDVLKKLYAQMLKARMRSDASAQCNEALIGAIVDLVPGDAVSLLAGNAAVRTALEPSPQIHQVPPHLGLAAGVALACKLQDATNVVVALAKRSTLDTGSAHEALTIASAQKLPLIVVLDCAHSAEADALETKAAAYGIPPIEVDGHDAVAVYRVAREAVDRARTGRGPTLIQCLTIEPVADPIPRIEHYLEKHGWWTPAWKRELTSRSK